MNKIVIWGASGHALVVADIVRCDGMFELVGFLDDVNPDRRGEAFAGRTILGGREQLNRLQAAKNLGVIIAIGDCDARLRIAGEVAAAGGRIVSVVHPAAVVAAGVEIGAGTVVAAGAVLAPNVRLGSNVIINTSATVDHECDIGHGVHIGPGAHLGGRVTVGDAAWIGIGATVRDRVTIGARAVIGAGAVAVKDLPPNVVAYGVPCTVMQTRGPTHEK
jgi:acetyltransferase EpsM